MRRAWIVVAVIALFSIPANAGPSFFPIIGVASANNVLLVNTASTTVITYSNSIAGNYMLHWSYLVSTATTNVTLSASWTDQSGTAQVMTYSTASAKAVGAHHCLSVPINSQASAAITVTAQAGTANQVNVSAVLEQKQ